MARHVGLEAPMNTQESEQTVTPARGVHRVLPRAASLLTKNPARDGAQERRPGGGSWPLAVAFLLLVSTSCAKSVSEDGAGDRPGASPATSVSTPIETRVPQDPVLTPGPGEVLELDQDGPQYVFTKAGRYAVRLGPDLVYEVDSPEMWEVLDGRFFNTSDFSAGAGIFFIMEAPAGETWLPADPCQDRTRVPIGPTAGDLADAWAAQPVYEVTGPSKAAIAGQTGVSLELRIPDAFDSSACQGRSVVGFTTTSTVPNWFVYGEHGMVAHLSILDVDGQRFVMASMCESSCTEADFQTLRTMAESVTFVRAG